MEKIEQICEKLTVLIVDDMEAIRGMVASCLKELGIRNYHSATNGSSAWKTIQSTSIHMIICDWDMPELTGIELLKLVKESSEYQHIPFLMLTAAQDKKSVVEAVSNGVDSYLAKPFRPKELEYRIVRLLRKVKL